MQKFITKTFSIKGMTCVHCQNTIEEALKSSNGVKSITVSFTTSKATITFDSDKISFIDIKDIIRKLDYHVVNDEDIDKISTKDKFLRFSGTVIVLLILYQIIRMFGGLNFFSSFPEVEQGMSYGILFLLGLLTSVHCVAMCGGINISQCVSNVPDKRADISSSKTQNISINKSNESSSLDEFNSSSKTINPANKIPTIKYKGPSPEIFDPRSKMSAIRPSFLYNSGRVISYTVIGGIVGALGSVISFPGMAKGIVAILAGVFMVIMGLNMLSLFPGLRRFNISMPRIFSHKINSYKNSNRPFFIGILNGLMPCGPLQAMQLFALSTGDPVKGALSMLFFSLGTVPLMFGLGAFSALMNKTFATKMRTVSAALVVILGVMMFGNGMSLSGFAVPSFSGITNKIINYNNNNNNNNNDDDAIISNISAGTSTELNSVSQESGQENIQIIKTTLDGGDYAPITVKSGIPVKWTISAKAKDINGCNSTLVIPKYNIKKKLVSGDNIIEFTPTKSGTIPYSCWMGMITSTITVVEK